MLLQKDSRVDPHLEILRLGVEHEDVAARDITVTLVLDGALVTGTVNSGVASSSSTSPPNRLHRVLRSSHRCHHRRNPVGPVLPGGGTGQAAAGRPVAVWGWRGEARRHGDHRALRPAGRPGSGLGRR
ncbi:hypothetical protein KCH_77470 [Kitasatospora cheerisanensis KCTC 2395]|uniref:Uncharacterized protein n=1 Tax=Kitasatospora cheerisanensis KCTC 2395 TaxID=1348663 RepID=A0A066YG87_9ACTN|nr:hypothetical protein KCH_77470 [Kitasatospora cheerisanensis KCTC 2395]